MTQIPLHRERGLDPHLTYCPRCGGEGRGLTIGEVVALRFSKDGKNQTCYANRGRGGAVKREMTKLGWYFEGYSEVKEREKLPDNEPCDTCKMEMKEHAEIVAAGGVYWRCTECRREGVIRPSPFADDVRKAHKLTNGEPCGIEFTSCAEHTPTE